MSVELSAVVNFDTIVTLASLYFQQLALGIEDVVNAGRKVWYVYKCLQKLLSTFWFSFVWCFLFQDTRTPSGVKENNQLKVHVTKEWSRKINTETKNISNHQSLSREMNEVQIWIQICSNSHSVRMSDFETKNQHFFRANVNLKNKGVLIAAHDQKDFFCSSFNLLFLRFEYAELLVHLILMGSCRQELVFGSVCVGERLGKRKGV